MQRSLRFDGSQPWVLRGVAAALAIGVWGASAFAQVAVELDDELMAALTPLDRQILEYVNESQLEQLLSGADPAAIYLSNGDTLSTLVARTQAESSRHLYFAPVASCRLFDTRTTAQGALLAGETRGFSLREGEQGYALQGGAESGCALPGLEGKTLRTNTVRALALNVMTVDVAGPGSLAVWAANRQEPEIGSVSFASALAGGGVTGGVLVPVCDEAGIEPCAAADFKIKAKISGAHVVADVVGYFHARVPGAEVAAARDGEVAERAETAAPGAPGAPGQLASGAGASRAAEAGFFVTPGGRRVVADRSAAQSERTGETIPSEELEALDPLLRHLLADSATAADRGGCCPYEISLRGELATGHGDGAAVYGWIPNDQNRFLASAVKGHAVTGNGVYGEADTGRGVTGYSRASGYGVYGLDVGPVGSSGHGGYFFSSHGVGAKGLSYATRVHPNIYAPGIYGESLRGVGVYGRGDTSDSYNFYNEGGRFEGGKGLYALGTDPNDDLGYGARIYSNLYRGMYVQAGTGWFDAYFGGDTGISTDGVVDRSARSTFLVKNLGGTAIAPGDLVALAGTVPGVENGKPTLGVAKLNASNREAVIGVAHSAILAKEIEGPDTPRYTDFSPIEGFAAPQQYLTIVTAGLAPAVNLSSLPSRASWRIGERIELASGRSGEEAIRIGKIASAPDVAKGTVAVFVAID